MEVIAFRSSSLSKFASKCLLIYPPLSQLFLGKGYLYLCGLRHHMFHDYGQINHSFSFSSEFFKPNCDDCEKKKKGPVEATRSTQNM